MRCGPNGSRRHSGPNFSRDPSAEARGQGTVAEGSEALQGQCVPPIPNKAPCHSEAEHELQGHQEETVLFRGAAYRGVLLTKISSTALIFMQYMYCESKLVG